MSSYKTPPTPGDTAWFTHDRFRHVHSFRLYAMPARHEWVKITKRSRKITTISILNTFNPDLYDPKEWARQAKAGRHEICRHDNKTSRGLLPFDSKYTDYKSTNTLCGKDLIREYGMRSVQKGSISVFTTP